MTDDEKLELLDKQETAAWEALRIEAPQPHIELYCMKTIERCQRIRVGMKAETNDPCSLSNGTCPYKISEMANIKE